MSEFLRHKIKYIPKEITGVDISAIEAQNGTSQEEDSLNDDINIVKKLLDHLKLISDYRDKLDAVDFLINNAENLAGNLRYEVTDPSIASAVKELGGDGTYVDFDIFKIAVKEMIEFYDETALLQLTGADND
jgi:hypothetical protein